MSVVVDEIFLKTSNRKTRKDALTISEHTMPNKHNFNANINLFVYHNPIKGYFFYTHNPLGQLQGFPKPLCY